MTAFAKENNINAASVTGIGAFESAILAFFEVETKQYREIPVEGQTEVLSLVGDITLDADGTPLPHLHAVLGFSDGHTRGGHFLKGIVKPTLEVVIHETPSQLKRRFHPELGLALIDVQE
ncbi:DNA-binding protein [Agrobacterium tumefaciens]|uniref:PPC domain-containing DNA-binding protein n=1 Tax=Agrobacterium tumefaciens TaxID=358 RepID=UPI00287D2223|nr:DNA-binding protein [Agrobacterium tumefaciens]MDS7594642.1 DNA-binding protein [Agrobacterium tumefaciens]